MSFLVQVNHKKSVWVGESIFLVSVEIEAMSLGPTKLTAGVDVLKGSIPVC